jgi:hypothetical protein
MTHSQKCELLDTAAEVLMILSAVVVLVKIVEGCPRRQLLLPAIFM